jgi:hypothetical protein
MVKGGDTHAEKWARNDWDKRKQYRGSQDQKAERTDIRITIGQTAT